MVCNVCHPEVKAKWCKYCMPVPLRYRKIWSVPSFNPIQAEAYKLLKKNSKSNLLVLSKTGTGKTLIMELAIQRRIEKNRKGKILILEPLKALAKEKVDTLRKRFTWMTTIEMTSDVNLGHGIERNKKLLKADIVVCSYEMLDVMSRKPEIYSFLDKVNLLVVDEIHELGDHSRGADLDGCITRFLLYKKETNQPIQFIGLSATFDNPDDLKSYIEQFVPKVHVLTSDFSPIKVIVDSEIYSYPRFQRVPALMRLIPKMLNNKGELLVMFLSIGDTYKVVNNLNNLYPNIARLHHADLKSYERERIEKDFRDRKFRILVCTPTMLAGVNLPCQSLILDVSYFNQETFQKDVLPIQKITQASGRVGRLPYYTTGYVKYICDHEVINLAKAEMMKKNICKGTILNKLDDILNVQINMQTQMIGALKKWYKKTFSSKSSDMHEDKLEELFNATLTWLEAHNYIEITGKKLIGTTKGEITMKSKVRPMFLEHALEVLNEYKPVKGKFSDDDLLRLTEELFSTAVSDIPITERKMEAIKDNMQYQWLRTRKNSMTLDWNRNNDYQWISHISMALRQLSYPLSVLLEDKEKKKYLSYLRICYQKGIIPMNLIKLSRLLTKNHIQMIGNKRLILLQLNGFTYEALKEGKPPRLLRLPMHIEKPMHLPLPYCSPDMFAWGMTGKEYDILPDSMVQKIRKVFSGKYSDIDVCED